MKPKTMLFGAVVAVCGVCLLCSGLYAYAKDHKPAKEPPAAAASDSSASAAGGDEVSFEQTKDWNKLEPRLQAAWLDAKKSGDMTRRLDCFVRVRERGDKGDESFLFSHGFVVRAFSGPVATGHTTAADLQSVAGLPFVASIKLSSH
ncbi:MAG: hypothetical protein V2A66_05305 [Pseudomonadota bacterium]